MASSGVYLPHLSTLRSEIDWQEHKEHLPPNLPEKCSLQSLCHNPCSRTSSSSLKGPAKSNRQGKEQDSLHHRCMTSVLGRSIRYRQYHYNIILKDVVHRPLSAR